MTSILRFPTMLRKMWSGGEVQDWLDTNQDLKDLQAEVVRLREERDSYQRVGIQAQQRLTVATGLIRETMARFEDNRFPGIRLMQRLREFNRPGCADGEKPDGHENS